MTPKLLIADLVGQIQEIARAAQAGDEDSRAWLVEAFPGHVHFFIECWPPNYSPPPPAIIATLRRGAATPESLRIVERIARGDKGRQGGA